MDFVVWGAGTQGKRFAKFMEKHSQHNIKAFIDICAKNKINEETNYSIVAYDDYKEKYYGLPVVVCMADKIERDKIKGFLKSENVVCFSYCDCVGEMFYPIGSTFPIAEMLEMNNIRSEYIGVYGNNLFSVVLYDYLASCGISVRLAYSNFSLDYKFFCEQGYKCESLDALLSKDYLILHTEEGYVSDSYNQLSFNDFIQLPMYRNNELAKLKNAYKNRKRCFIVATGPSLKIEDLDILHKNNELCISVNKVYLSFTQTKWRPEFLIVSDPFIPDANIDDLFYADVEYKLIGDGANAFWNQVVPNENNIFRLHVDCRDYVSELPKFSYDVSYGLYNGRTVTYACLQLAMYLGITEIYLLGVDCSYKKTKDDDENHFIKGYSATNTVAPNGTGTYMLQHNAYKKAKQVADEAGVKIYNASRYTELDVFERVDFDSLFE